MPNVSQDMLLNIRETLEITIEAPQRSDGTPVPDHDTFEFVRATGPVERPLLVTSDLHHNALVLLDAFAARLEQPTEWTILTLGDMSGTGMMGSDGDALPALERAMELFGRLYFIQGNHDMESAEASNLRNADGSHCHLHGRVQDIEGIGRIAGIDGIIGTKNKPHRLAPARYFELLQRLLARGLDWLVTHEAPQIPEITGNHRAKLELREAVLMGNRKPRIHAYGHCHMHHWLGELETITFVGVDGRAVCIEPAEA